MKNPKIRFKDDNIDWENKKIEDILEPYTEKNINNYPGVAIGRYGIRRREEIYSKELSKDATKNKVINKNTLTVGMGSTQIDIGILHTDEHFSVSPAYHTFNILDNDSKFIESSFAKNNEKYSKQHMIIGARQGKSVDFPNFLADIIYLPSIEVQQKIASLLTYIEDKITKQENMVQKLKDTKSALLIKMFPQENQSVPTLRFNDFTDTWEQRKLSDISKKISEKNTKNEISETFTNSAEYGVISQRDFFDRNITNTENINTYYIVRNEDFVYNPRISTSAPCGPINRNRLNRVGVMSPLYTVFRTKNIDTLYLEWFFKTPHWYPYMYLNGDTGARSDRFSIKNETFFNMPIPFPNDEEQKKIGTFLETLDNLITLHQRKLDKLKEVKSALLDKLLV